MGGIAVNEILDCNLFFCSLGGHIQLYLTGSGNVIHRGGNTSHGAHQRARAAARILATAKRETKDAALHAMADALDDARADGGFHMGGDLGLEILVLLAVLFVGVVLAVVFVTKGQRRIPTQSAKHVRGRQVYGGTRQYLPLRVNQAGVMPIIFASSLLLFPQFLFTYLASNAGVGAWGNFIRGCNEIFTAGQSYLYVIIEIVLIYFFCYFWTAVTFNPKDMAENLKNHGTFIQGYRPGASTANYLEKVMLRITYVGASFLAIIAIVPTLITSAMNVDYVLASFFGGTSLLIAVSVVLDLVDKIDAHLIMRNYKSLLD